MALISIHLSPVARVNLALNEEKAGLHFHVYREHLLPFVESGNSIQSIPWAIREEWSIRRTHRTHCASQSVTETKCCGEINTRLQSIQNLSAGRPPKNQSTLLLLLLQEVVLNTGPENTICLWLKSYSEGRWNNIKISLVKHYALLKGKAFRDDQYQNWAASNVIR